MFDPIEAVDTIEGVAVVLYDWWLVAQLKQGHREKLTTLLSPYRSPTYGRRTWLVVSAVSR